MSKNQKTMPIEILHSQHSSYSLGLRITNWTVRELWSGAIISLNDDVTTDKIRKSTCFKHQSTKNLKTKTSMSKMFFLHLSFLSGGLKDLVVNVFYTKNNQIISQLNNQNQIIWHVYFIKNL